MTTQRRSRDRRAARGADSQRLRPLERGGYDGSNPSVFSSTGIGSRLACVDSGLLDRVVRREALLAQGKSGAQLERGWLADGSTVVLKHIDARDDWIMQATGDDGRIADLWADGTLRRVPAGIDHAILDVAPADGGAVVVMRDVSAHLAADGQMPLSFHRRVVTAAAQLHTAFAGAPINRLCELSAYYGFLSPGTCMPFAAHHDIPRLAVEGWARFHDIVAPDVAEVIAALHENPSRLVDALLARDCTLVHGDLKLANLGEQADRVIVLDWGTLTVWAPPAVDFAWYLAINAAALGVGHDEILHDISLAQAKHDDIAQRLALIGALVQLGWEKALGATADDAETRRRERIGLEWWTAQVRLTLPLL